MSTINNVGAGLPVSRVEVLAPSRSSARTNASETQQPPARSPDTVDLSEQARYKDALREGSDVRVDLVERIRAEIAAGTYDTYAKLDQAVDNLIDDLNA